MKKTLCVLLSLLLLLGMTSLAQADEAMTLRLWVRYDDDFSACIADFEALHPGVKIIQEQVGNSYDDLLAKYNTGMQSNDMPNIGVTGQRNGIPQLYDAGWLLPIENYLTAKEMDDVVENFWTRYTYDGKRMSMPFSCTIPGCYVNLTMLHELGYENMPETLDELCAEGALELCKCLSTGEYDEERGKLTTYLHPFLRGKMYRYLEENIGATALPKDEMQRRIRLESRPRNAPHRCHHNNCHHQQQRIVEYTAPPARIATLLLLGCLRRVLRSFPDQIIRRHTEVRADGAQLVEVGRRVAAFPFADGLPRDIQLRGELLLR